MHRIAIISAFLLLALSPNHASCETSIISARGNGESSVCPDKAVILFTIEVVRDDALTAASDAASIFKDITSRLHGLGIDRDGVVTTRFAVAEKKERQPPRMEEIIIGHSARHGFKVATTEFERIGAIVNAVLGAGSTSVRDIQFFSSELSRAQQEALAEAAKAALQQATTMAAAVGGKLGRLLEMNSETYSWNAEVHDSLGGGAVSVPVTIVPDRIVAQMRVSAKWEYLPENE